MYKNFFAGVDLETLIKYIDGEAGDDIKRQVEDWLDKEQDRVVFLEKLKIAWNDYDKIKSLTPESIDEDWRYILNHIDSGHKIIEMQPQPWYRSTWLYAAALVLLIFSLAGGYFLGKAGNTAPKENALVYNEIIVPMGEKSQVVLSDGTKVWVNAGSKLKFPDRFGSNSREVWLEGEAFFEVSKDKSRPFYVRTSDLNIKVLGTKFNVKAYSDEGIIETTLVEGLVSLERKNKVKKGEDEIFLKPNHKAIYAKDELTLLTEEIKREITEPLEPKKIIISKPVEVEMVTSWKDGKLIFEGETLESVAKKLERRYDVVININEDSIKLIKYSGVLKNISIEQAMKAIQVTSEFRFVVKGNKIDIYKN